MKKPENKLLLPRPLSWSSMSLLEKDEARWIRKYLKGEKVDFTNAGMRFGKKVADHLESTEETDDMELSSIKSLLPRYEVTEMHLKCFLQCPLGDIELIGQCDTAEKDLSAFREVKTGLAGSWSDSKAQRHGQLHFYATMIYIITGNIPKAHLDWLKTVKGERENNFTGELVSFYVKLAEIDIMKMRLRIIKNARRIDELVRTEMKSL